MNLLAELVLKVEAPTNKLHITQLSHGVMWVMAKLLEYLVLNSPHIWESYPGPHNAMAKLSNVMKQRFNSHDL